MKPIGQLFGLMVERIEGCPYKEIKDDMRESVAIDLLFSHALNCCKKQGNLDAFIQPKTTVRRSPRNLTPKDKDPGAPQQKQTSMDTYFTHKLMIDEYSNQKKKAKESLKEKKAKGNS